MDEQRRERLWQLVAALIEHAGERPEWVRAVCEVAAGEVHADAAVISLRTAGRAQDLVAASGDWAESLEELQYTVGDGPAVEAFTTGEPVLVDDLTSGEGRWPGFADGAAETGAAAAFAFPLQTGAVRLGTLGLYRHRPGSLSPEELANALTLADLSTTALLTDSSGAISPVANWAREDVPGHYDDVHIATGMLATQLQISLADALLRLRAHAFSRHLPLIGVARAVLNRELRLDSFTD
ncbi:GAF and ANTAR domain-containing protein [Amycolatopsis sp. NPDC005232]|uniref:GAF and ANTAR domain-containing protein n=1 Tax=Amycolatopsis sp. NPDC005232 TaxID=3157027 RepID=UPI00339E0436